VEEGGEALISKNGARREELLTMDKNGRGFGMEESGIRSEESRAVDLQQMLQKVDRMIEEFYQIHGPLIKDQGHNP
jgi:hypothetical protein